MNQKFDFSTRYATLVFIERESQGRWYRTSDSFVLTGERSAQDAVVAAYKALAEILEFEGYDGSPRRAIVVSSEEEAEGGVETVILYTHGSNRAPHIDQYCVAESKLQRERADQSNAEFRSQS